MYCSVNVYLLVRISMDDYVQFSDILDMLHEISTKILKLCLLMGTLMLPYIGTVAFVETGSWQNFLLCKARITMCTLLHWRYNSPRFK